MLCQLSYCPSAPPTTVIRRPQKLSEGARKQWWFATKRSSVLTKLARVEPSPPRDEASPSRAHHPARRSWPESSHHPGQTSHHPARRCSTAASNTQVAMPSIAVATSSGDGKLGAILMLRSRGSLP